MGCFNGVKLLKISVVFNGAVEIAIIVVRIVQMGAVVMTTDLYEPVDFVSAIAKMVRTEISPKRPIHDTVHYI